MMNQYQVPAFIAGKLPQIRNDLTQSGPDLDIYQSIQVLTDYTKRMAIEHNFKMVENVFIFSFSSIMAICNIIEWRIVQSYMPSCLYTLYVQQVLRSKD